MACIQVSDDRPAVMYRLYACGRPWCSDPQCEVVSTAPVAMPTTERDVHQGNEE